MLITMETWYPCEHTGLIYNIRFSEGKARLALLREPQHDAFFCSDQKKAKIMLL
jgi:Fe2+ or Zn2+ uptake regulation protein